MLLLCGLCHTGVFVCANDRNAQSSKSWGYEPVFDFAPTAPQYQFHTTSAYISSLNESGPHHSLRRGSSLFGDDDDYDDDYEPGPAIGEVEDDQPIGDIPWLLMFLLSAGYIAYRVRSRSKAKL